MSQSNKCAVVALISGRGSNLQAIIDQAHSGELPIDLRAVISNRPEAPGLARAQAAGISTATLDHKTFESREAFDEAMMALIDSFKPDLVVLAGFMRILTEGFARHYEGRMLNIHPSLLPKYRGLHTHQRAIEAGDTSHGASIHFVTPELDGGPVALQASVPIAPDDDADALAAKVLQKEHRLYPQAIKWYAEGRLCMREGCVWFDDGPLDAPLSLED